MKWKAGYCSKMHFPETNSGKEVMGHQQWYDLADIASGTLSDYPGLVARPEYTRSFKCPITPDSANC